MLKSIIPLLCCAALIFANSAFALTDDEYKELCTTSPGFKQADRELGKAWKELMEVLNKKGEKSAKKNILSEQKDWIKDGRDEDADYWMLWGFDREGAYTKATQRRRNALRLMTYNYGLSKADQDAGRARADDYFDGEDELEIPLICGYSKKYEQIGTGINQVEMINLQKKPIGKFYFDDKESNTCNNLLTPDSPIAAGQTSFCARVDEITTDSMGLEPYGVHPPLRWINECVVPD